MINTLAVLKRISGLCYSRCSPWTSIIGSIRKYVITLGSQAHPTPTAAESLTIAPGFTCTSATGKPLLRPQGHPATSGKLPRSLVITNHQVVTCELSPRYLVYTCHPGQSCYLQHITGERTLAAGAVLAVGGCSGCPASGGLSDCTWSGHSELRVEVLTLTQLPNSPATSPRGDWGPGSPLYCSVHLEVTWSREAAAGLALGQRREANGAKTHSQWCSFPPQR